MGKVRCKYVSKINDRWGLGVNMSQIYTDGWGLGGNMSHIYTDGLGQV
jgi:hypothetical protein